MPSDDRARSALDAIGGRAQAFRAALATTSNEIRKYVGQRREADAERPTVAAVLGTFAMGRIDSDRFARLIAPPKLPAAGGVAVLERALAVLEELERQGDDLFRVKVERGGDLVGEVERALANAGRAFGAARVANQARSHQSVSEEQGVEHCLDSFPFRHWGKAERNLAPPLVIEVAGGDVVVEGLAAYMDGNQNFILVVEGQASPAPLAGLIRPGVFVLQTDDTGALKQLAEAAGPGVAALLPAGSVRFLYRPTDGAGLGHLEMDHVPAQEPRRPVGSRSVFQQQQELRLLAVLAGLMAQPEAPAAPAAVVRATEVMAHVNGQGNGASPGPAAAPIDPVGALTAWLLATVDLSDLESGEARQVLP